MKTTIDSLMAKVATPAVITAVAVTLAATCGGASRSETTTRRCCETAPRSQPPIEAPPPAGASVLEDRSWVIRNEQPRATKRPA